MREEGSAAKDMSPPPGYHKYHLASFRSTFASPSCSRSGPQPVLPDPRTSQVLPSSAGPHILPVQTKKKNPECALRWEDSQLLKHHSCTAAEDAAGKVPRHWIPPAPTKTTDTPYYASHREKKGREERRRRGAGRRGRDEKRRKEKRAPRRSRGRGKTEGGKEERESPVRLGPKPKQARV